MIVARRSVTGTGSLVMARHMKDEATCVAAEVAYLFLPDVSRGQGGGYSSVQMIFVEDDSYVAFTEQIYATLIDRGQIPLGDDGYWELASLSPESVMSSLPAEVKEWVSEDKQVSLNEFLAALGSPGTSTVS